MLALNNMKLVHKPEQYHGDKIQKRFFEGWYYKTCLKDDGGSLIFIPGVFMPSSQTVDSFEKNCQGHAFVMCFRNPNPIKCLYYAYPLSEFSFENNKNGFGYMIRIGKSVFTHESVNVDLEQAFLVPHSEIEERIFYQKSLDERIALYGKDVMSDFNQYPLLNLSVKGEIKILNSRRIPSSTLSPGVMGPFGYIPILECYHGVVSMYHETEGKVDFFNNDGSLESIVSVNSGTGYIEKDHGVRFPKSWIWIQTLSFEKPSSKGSCLLVSLADVPILHDDGLLAKIPKIGDFLVSKTMMTGFLAVFYHSESQKTYNLSLFTGASIKKIDFTLEKNRKDGTAYQICQIETKLRKISLSIIARRELGAGIPIRGPIGFNSGMKLVVEESLNVEIDVTLKIDGKIVFRDIGKEAGMEVVGSMAGLKERISI